MTFKFSGLEISVQRLIAAAAFFCLIFISALYQTERVGAVALTTDYAFGTNGVAQTDIASYITHPTDLAIQPDGKIIVVGYARASSEAPYFTVTRYNPNGTLDTTFDGDGIVTGQFRIAGDYFSSRAQSLAIQPDGKIVIAGDSTTVFGSASTTEFAAARLNPNGSFDTTFGTDGKVTFSAAPTQRDYAYQVALQPNGKIVLSGEAGNGTNEFAPALARLNPNGSLDTTFFEDGMVDYVGSIYGIPSALYIQPDGKINVVTDIISPTSSDELTVFLRYNADGSPDTTFGGSGRRSTGAIGRVNSVGFQPDGKMILGSQYFTLVRLNTDYSLDTSFGNNGSAAVTFGQYFDWMNDLAVQADGKIVVAGYTNTQAGFNVACDFTIARFNADGTLDTTFDLDGKIVKSIGSNYERAHAVRALPNGKILIIGKAGQTDGLGKETLLRFMGDLNTTDFDGDTKTDISVFRPAIASWYILQSSEGYQGINIGVLGGKPVPGDYTGDGKTDIAMFDSLSGWSILRSETTTFTYVRFGQFGDIAVPADYDGDGKTDVAVYRPSTGVWYRLNSSDGTVSGVQFGAAEDKPVAGDYDADGKTDISVYRPSSGAWYRLNSSNGQFFGVQFGASEDKPVAADFDGDSKSDIAVFRPSNGTWYWTKSSNGNFEAIAFGQNGDVPVAADYDGDGKSDVAVFRPSNGVWYLYRSQLGFTGTVFGQNGDLPLPAAFIQ